MAERLIIFDTTSLVRLLTHYTEGEVPLDSEVVEFGINPHLQRLVMLLVRSAGWKETRELTGAGELFPYHFEYEGKRTMKWGSKGEDVTWGPENAIEAPRQQ